jgi:hypothetical protein
MSVTTTFPTAYGQNGQNANNAFVLYQLMKYASIDIETLADWINNFPSGGIITTDIIGDVYAPNGTTKALENASANYTNAVSTPVLFGRVIDNEYRLGTGSAGLPLEDAMASLQAMFGSLGVQSWNTNNTSLMDNMYLDGAGYRFTKDGKGILAQFLGDEVAFSFAPADLAGEAAVLTRKVVIGANDLKIGTPIDNYYNCYFPYGGANYLYSYNNVSAFKHSFVDGRYITYYGAGGAINTPVTWLEIGSNPIENYYNCYFDGANYRYLDTSVSAFRHSFVDGQYTTYYGAGGNINDIVIWEQQTKISLANGLEVVKGTDFITVLAPNNIVTINAQAGKISGILNYTIAASSNITIQVINSFCTSDSIPIASFNNITYIGAAEPLLLSVGNVTLGSFVITIQNLSATNVTISTDINFVLV